MAGRPKQKVRLYTHEVNEQSGKDFYRVTKFDSISAYKRFIYGESEFKRPLFQDKDYQVLDNGVASLRVLSQDEIRKFIRIHNSNFTLKNKKEES